MASRRKTEQLQIRVTPEQKARIRRASRRAGVRMSAWILAKLLPARGGEFMQMVRELERREQRLALAAINDFLSDLRPGDFEEAVGVDPGVKLEPLRANLLAAMVEQAAAGLGKRAPTWVRDVEPLREPWFATQIVALRLHLMTVSPPAYRRRNLFVDATVGDRV